jgi:hypothetical protein
MKTTCYIIAAREWGKDIRRNLLFFRRAWPLGVPTPMCGDELFFSKDDTFWRVKNRQFTTDREGCITIEIKVHDAINGEGEVTDLPPTEDEMDAWRDAGWKLDEAHTHDHAFKLLVVPRPQAEAAI